MFITFYTTTSALVLIVFIMQGPLSSIKELAKDPTLLVVCILFILINIPLWNHLITT